MIQTLLTLLLAPLLRLLARRPATPPARVLVVQVAKIGDVISTTPLLRELRAGLPAAHIVVMAAPLTAPLLRANPRIDEVRIIASRDWRGLKAKLRLAARLRRDGFDAVLCCNGGATWPTLALWAGIPLRVGIAPNFGGRTSRLAARLWSCAVPHTQGRLVIETMLDLARPLGIAPGSLAKEAFAGPGAAAAAAACLPEGGQYIGIAVSAGNKMKELGTAKLAAVVGRLAAARPAATFVLLGADADREASQTLIADLPVAVAARVIDTCGRLELAAMPALLARLTLFIGVDSGLTYMADALPIPLVSVAGPADMEDARPLNSNARILRRPLPCVPCSHYFHAPYNCAIGTRACIVDVTVDEISAAALQLLARIET
ncbi:MAG: glycosyltransferase family 9 protein [Sulfurisoma sp.]|nr:glycosyltransferase family 9 protein [Sulfurisoma sp.]